MAWLVWIGVAVTLLGLAGLGLCVARVVQARRAGLADAELRRRVQRVVAWNTAALGVSALGLAAVVVGLLLG